MKKSLLTLGLGMLLSYSASAQLKIQLASLESQEEGSAKINENQFLNKTPREREEPEAAVDFKPTVQVGALMHSYFESAQTPVAAGSASEGNWNSGFSLYRARVLVGAQLSPKGSFFMETDIPNIIGTGGTGATKDMKVSPVILDFQYEHVFSNRFSLIVGKQLVSNNRNGLQSAASLMANDFTHYQYPYNMFNESPLQGNFGRDIGVNARGFLMNEKLEYRLGAFSGRRFGVESPLRIVGRLQYSLLGPEKDFYYAGTKLGAGKTATIGGGVDSQSDYINLNVDGFVDMPLGEAGSITANAAFAYMDGGSDGGAKSFSTLIPRQTVQFLELGYYFKKAKVQPWIKYENQIMMEGKEYYGMGEAGSDKDLDNANLLASNIRLGGGVNYFFNGYNTNLKVSYTEAVYSRLNEKMTDVERKGAGQLWVQLQLFFF